MTPYLTEPQKRHLLGLLRPRPDSLFGDSKAWHPFGSGEQRCAAALKNLGLVNDHYTHSGVYVLTDAGVKVAKSLRAGEGSSPEEPAT